MRPGTLAAERAPVERAGSLEAEIPYWGWLADGRTLLTAGGELVALGRLGTYEASGRPGEYLDYVLGRWVRLLSGTDARTRVYLYLLRRPLAEQPVAVAAEGPRAALAERALAERNRFLGPRLQSLEVYAGFARDARLKAQGEQGSPLAKLRAAFGPPARAVAWAAAAVEREAREFAEQVDAAAGLVADLTPIEMLGPEPATRALSELVNAPGRAAGLTFGGEPPLAWRLALSEIEAHADHLRVDGEAVVLHSLLAPPQAARANQLGDLLRLPCRTLELAWEWAPAPQEEARRRLRRAQKHFWQKRYSTASQMLGGGGMVDQSAVTEADRIAEAGAELSSAGVAYGDLSLSLALHGADVGQAEQSQAELRRIFGSVDAKLIRERYWQLGAWFARSPGQPRPRQLRRVFVSAGVAAALAPLFGPSRGHPECRHLGAPALAVLETRAGTAYHLDLFAGGDVGHTLVLGSTGSGKSFLLNFLLVHALRYGARIAILDLGGSYRWLTRLAGGGYLALDAEGGTGLNPFQLAASERSFRFLAGWTAGLLQIGGYRPTGDDLSEIRQCVEDLYRLPAERRRLGQLAGSLPMAMRPALGRWHGPGPWARVFDRPTDALAAVSDWQAVDLAGAREHPDLAAAALRYALERLAAGIEDPAERERPKILVVDEAWRFLRDPEVAAYLLEAAKTWRKQNAALVLATQSGVDVTEGSAAAALLESCPTRIFLANPTMDAGHYGQVFALSESETQAIRELQPKRELYLRRPQEAEALRLHVDRRSYWLYTSNPNEAARRERALEAHGGDLEAALEALANGYGRTG